MTEFLVKAILVACCLLLWGLVIKRTWALVQEYRFQRYYRRVILPQKRQLNQTLQEVFDRQSSQIAKNVAKNNELLAKIKAAAKAYGLD